ncbi:MAG: bifunctional adenosylcobinamide kinase/adenosylcobinamide-phosphate guanylyltransferase [Chloroflexota bacterium]
MPRILITGGARSGKSHFAQELAAKLGGPVLFVATAEPLDAEMAKRIKIHKKKRPQTWKTLELTRHLGSEVDRIASTFRVVVIDCITLLISNILSEHTEPLPEALIEKECEDEVEHLITCMRHHETNFVIVTNEVGEGLVPVNKVGRLYRDLLGKANQTLARDCDTVYLMVAGIPFKIKSAYAQ